jgi:hypothetical protein
MQLELPHGMLDKETICQEEFHLDSSADYLLHQHEQLMHPSLRITLEVVQML